MSNVFNRTIRITLYEVDVDSDGLVVKREPEEKKDFIVTPLSLGAIDAIEQWARQEVLDRNIKLLRDNKAINTEEFYGAVAAETKRVSELGWSSEEIHKVLSTLEGAACIVWKCLTGHDQTYEQLVVKMVLPENQNEAWKTIRRLDTLDTWGVSHPSEALSSGQEKTTTKTLSTSE